MDWPEIYAHVIACTGWTWEYISDHVDLPRLEALNKYWAQFPPAHVLIAAYLGIKPQQKSFQITNPKEQDAIPAQTMSEADFDAMLKSKGLA